MIAITCTKCHTRLEIDDAFAGGVCRCQHCGTIQTVPSHLKAQATAATPQKSLYEGGGDAAEPQAPPTQTATAGKPNKALLVAGGVIILLLVSVILYLVMSSGGGGKKDAPGTTQSGTTDTDEDEDTIKITYPTFGLINLSTSQKVVYVLDRSQTNYDIFDTLKAALYRSIRSLKPGTQFAVIFWNNGTDLAYPDAGTVENTEENVSALENKLEDTVGEGSSTIDTAIAEAAKRSPDTIIITTAKGFQLDQETVAAVDTALKELPSVKIHTFSLSSGNEGVPSDVLAEIATKHGGEFKPLTKRQLRELSAD